MDLKYDMEMAKAVTGITDETILNFYIKGVICKIERVIGYDLVKSFLTEFVSGLGTNIIYLKKKPVENVSNAYIDNERINFKVNKHKLIFDFEIHQSEIVKVEYVAGYEELPFGIQNFIFSTIKEMISNEMSLKSFSLKDVSYTFLDKVQQSENFRRGITDLFGVM